jgi:LacI family transcriptional regulator
LSFIERREQPQSEPEVTLANPTVPTLEDVARAAKVSTATVSRCLNSPERVVEKTRKRVMAAVEALGYSPNFGAQALAAKRTNTIGAVIPTMDNAIFARGLQAFQEAIALRKATLLVASSYYRQEIEEQQIRALVARGADALLLIGESRSSDIYDFLRNRNIPYVLAWTFKQGGGHSFVGFDNRAAARDMANKVLALGHRRIAMIAGVTLHNDRARDRVLGVRDAAVAHGVNMSDLDVVEAPYQFDDASDAFELIMRRDPRPTAVICGNDILAIGALKQAKAMGLRVPDDVSVVGFDDIEISSVTEPGITTVHVPHRQMGQVAAEILIRQLQGKSETGTFEPESRELETRIVERGSLGPPPAPPVG